MAYVISELNAISHKHFDGTITPSAYEKSPYWAKMNADNKIVTDFGTSFQFPVRLDKLGRARRTTARAKVEFGSNETRTGGDIPMCFYDVNTMMHWDEKLKNAGKAKIIDLQKDRAKEMTQDLSDILSAALYATAPDVTLDMYSLPVIIDSADDYAGIVVSDAPEWASAEDNSTTIMKIYGPASLSYMLNQATFGTLGPTMHCTSRDLWSKYESILEPQKRYEDKSVANLGFDTLTFHKKPVFSDVFCPDNHWYGIDAACMEVRVVPDNMKPGDWFPLEQAGFPNAVARYLTWVGNIVSRRRKTHFKFTAFDYTAG